jgi:hypothetical protein
MKTNAFTPVLAVGLVLVAGLASASEPMQLTESQMDAVSAGQVSVASGSALSWYGTASSQATTSAFSQWPVRITNASAISVATGFGARATASAGSSF